MKRGLVAERGSIERKFVRESGLMERKLKEGRGRLSERGAY